MKRLTWAAGLMLLLAGCTVPELGELEKEKPRACNAEHACAGGYECVGGLCLPAGIPHECVPNTTEACGKNVGECRPGQRRCSHDGTWGACEGETGPKSEVCNDLDDDCDGQADEDFSLGSLCDMSNGCKGAWSCDTGGGRTCVVTPGLWHPDEDRDGQGARGSPGIDSCQQPVGHAPNAMDCDDTNYSRYSGASEVCNAVDEDCDGQVDEDFGGPACTCAATQEYVGGACVSRFASVTVLEPAEGTPTAGGEQMTVRVRLEVKPEFASNPKFPAELVFSGARAGGGQGGTFSAASAAEGVYEVKWLPPATGEGDFKLTAAVPDGAPSATVTVNVDRTPPTVVLVVPNPTFPSDTTGRTQYADPNATTSWRRDQEVRVEVQVTDANVDASSLTLEVKGTDGVGRPVTLTASTPCSVSACAQGTVKLWESRFDAFRGQMALVANARDKVGNTKKVDGGIPVTRWKWAYDLYDYVETTPAIGARGTIYVAARNRLVAVTPEGKLKWEAQPGSYLSTPVVGQPRDDGFGGTSELIYVAAGTNGSSYPELFAYDGNLGQLRTGCPLSGSYGSGSISGSLTLLTTPFGTSEREAVVAFLQGSANSNRFVAIRPDAETSVERCPEFGNALPRPIEPGRLVSQGTNLFYVSESSTCCSNNEVASYTFGSNQSRLDWPVKIDANLGSPVLVGPQLVVPGLGNGNNMRGLFSIATSGSLSTLRYPLPSSYSLGSVSVGSANEAFLNVNGSSGTELHRFPLGGGGTATVKGGFSGSNFTTPVLGRDGTLYSNVGTLSAWSSADLSARWSVSLPSGIPTGYEMTLDCARDTSGTQISGRPGVLYMPAYSDRRLYAFVVDSPGLDASAQWPKFQHDVRNTGNPATPVTNCK
ncbi:putative metal-binding motif-containing protein [Archangium lipolyticum]|uniref:putative metal-binding motif-containing protein n=1 Tax=Archangium lipolyticum TaxID=2970465 RepID=UPI002149FA01|nr:MopE-related protein [Archangium lipolyticum]